MFRVFSLVVLPLVALSAAARADSFTPLPLKQGTATSIGAYGQQNPRCAEWTDGCTVCVAADGRARCSTPGIACTPAGLTCRRPVRP